MPSTPLVLTSGVLVVLITFLLLKTKRKTPVAPYPPGPKPIPILGNVRDLTAKELWLPAARWAKEYGGLHLSSGCERAGTARRALLLRETTFHALSTHMSGYMRPLLYFLSSMQRSTLTQVLRRCCLSSYFWHRIGLPEQP